jgi:hypothetical protein
MGLFKKARKFVKKIIPKEIRPFIPYIAAAFGPAGLAGTKFATLNPAFQKAILAGGTKFATDDEADLKDIGVTAALAAAPTALDQFAGPTGPDPQGIMGTLRKGSRALAQKAKDSPYLTMGAQAGTDAAIKQAELDKDALEKYNADLLSQGIKDKGARRSAIFDIFINAGHDSDDVNIMLDKYGYADGGRIGFKSGDYVGSSDNETMEDEYDSYIKEIEIDGDTPMSFSSFKKMLSEDYANGGRVGLRFGGIGDAVENIEDAEMKEAAKFAMQDMDIPIMDLVEEFEIQFKRKPNSMEELKQFYKDRYEYKGPGDVKMQEEIKEKVVMEAKDGGLMNLGGKEMDMRGGGFIPIGKKERADDVPARLSKNEFVMTADAVRAAGGGSVNEGAKRMYETMNKLEARA